MKQWYEELFQNYAEKYEKEIYTQGTMGEVDFIEKEINFNKQCKILDIGCGTGRHSIELAKRGYALTGVDLSESMLSKAREKAKAQNVQVSFQQEDARYLRFKNEYDLVIMLCEGSFSLMETDEMNFMIMQNAAKALKEKGKLIFTTLNALFPLAHSIKDFMNVHEEQTQTSNNSFDLMTLRDTSTLEYIDDSGHNNILHCNERFYVPSEISWMLHSLGFQHVTICGCTLGAFSRDDRLTPDDFEMLVIAEY